MVCFAANSVITRYLVLVSQVSPFLVTVIRFVSGLGALTLLASLRSRRFPREKPNTSYLPGTFFLGAYAFSISYGYVFISVAAGTFIFYTFVVVTMGAYSVVLDKEPVTSRLLLGQLSGLIGVLVITFSRISSVTVTGILLMAATGASWGFYSAYGKRFTIAFSYTFNSFLVLGAFAIVTSIVLPILGQPVSTSITAYDLGLALYMGAISTALSYVLWNATVKQIPASLGGLVQLIVPVLAPIMGIVFLGEQVTAPLIFGGGLVLLGIYLAGSKASSIRTTRQ
jgi:drug/metabolite transporter (DMT)-like permease